MGVLYDFLLFFYFVWFLFIFFYDFCKFMNEEEFRKVDLGKEKFDGYNGEYM